MKRHQILVVVPAALFILSSGEANAGDTINEAGAMALVIDKWNESGPVIAKSSLSPYQPKCGVIVGQEVWFWHKRAVCSPNVMSASEPSGQSEHTRGKNLSISIGLGRE
jgi:hypothetical protein